MCLTLTLTLSLTIINRNRAKKSSFTFVNMVFLLMKTTFDCVSRILLFSTWLYVVNDGQFSSAKTVLAYYSTFLLLVVFNTVFNKSGEYRSAKTWTGKMDIQCFTKLAFQKSCSTH